MQLCARISLDGLAEEVILDACRTLVKARCHGLTYPSEHPVPCANSVNQPTPLVSRHHLASNGRYRKHFQTGIDGVKAGCRTLAIFSQT
jgi:hypothetical protein